MNPIAYQVITDRLVAMLESGTAPWHKPWTGGAASFPKNMVSKKHYNGINVWMLHMGGFSSAYFLTFKQAIDPSARARGARHGAENAGDLLRGVELRVDEFSHRLWI